MPPSLRSRIKGSTTLFAASTVAAGGLFVTGAVQAPALLIDRELGSDAGHRAGTVIDEPTSSPTSNQGFELGFGPEQSFDPKFAPGSSLELGLAPEQRFNLDLVSVVLFDDSFAALDGLSIAALDGVPVGQLEGLDLSVEAEPELFLVYEGADGELIDPERLGAWLADRNSPLADHADALVAAGIANDVDPRLVVGIAAIESSAGKRLPPGSHNAWGWSGNGPHGLKAWPSWPDAIHDFTERLARIYDTDNVDERFARKYVPPNWEKWLYTVRWVMQDI
jgi:hypothetical protein